MSRLQHLAIIGGGGFGTALACVAARAGRRARLWVRDAQLMAEINRSHENSRYLPGIRLPEDLAATTDLAAAGDADAVLLATPAQFLRPTLQKLAPHLKPGVPLLICAKGIETGTHLLLHQVVGQLAPDQPVAALSGPSFAGDIARGLPTAVTLACEDVALGEELVQSIGAQNLRPYLSTDVTGVEIGGALKNVIAIACGITEGQGLGESARAALMTRGLSEMTRLAVALGGQAETMMGLAGLGDLALSCNSRQSRNFTLGFRLGQGESLASILGGARGVFEGASTVSAALRLAERDRIDMPITAAVDTILQSRAAIADVIAGLLTRPYTTEAR
ncbi:MAG TPA: glycerol-3-phosphate acyltransferase [Alphaproteobacteria bacterium]|jgi:glycerol-3-phosphate dehydrogenase (NAD(P)+)|nr:glycerol-3-phosphate acyltransferase [Alphaproteobacteria bacterium]